MLIDVLGFSDKLSEIFHLIVIDICFFKNNLDVAARNFSTLEEPSDAFEKILSAFIIIHATIIRYFLFIRAKGVFMRNNAKNTSI